MNRLVISVVVTVVLTGIATPAHAAGFSSVRYSSCAALLSKYPNGVAQSKATARAAVRDGFARPYVSKSLYTTNNRRLDRDKDGVMCEQSG